MKNIVLLILGMFLVACSQQYVVTSTQNVIELGSSEENSNSGVAEIQPAEKTAAVSNEPVIAPVLDRTEPIKVYGSFEVRTHTENNTYLVENQEVRIELIDVDESGNGCLINVDGVTEFIPVEGDARIGGFDIHVYNAFAFRNFLEDSDMCKIKVKPVIS